MSKLRKNERNYLFYFTILFFHLHHTQKINLLKAIYAANFEKVNKTTYTSNQISKKYWLQYTPLKITDPACFCFYLFLLNLLLFLLVLL